MMKFDLHILALFSLAALTSHMVTATHTITLKNNCGSGVPVWVDSHPGKVAYVSAGLQVLYLSRHRLKTFNRHRKELSQERLRHILARK